jgi:hypothetical protein
MSTENNKMPDEQQETDHGEKERRGQSYPVREHSFVVNFVSKIYTELGYTAFHSKERIAEIHGLAVPSIRQILSTAQQYKLLEIKHGTGYKVTSLFIRIYRPVNDQEKKEAIIESLRSPDFFVDLFNDFTGHVVPSNNGIANIFIRKGLKEIAATRLAEIFITNLKEYGLVNQNNILSYASPETGVDKKNNNTINGENSTPETKKTKEEDSIQLKPGIVDIVIPLKSTTVKAHLLIPEDYKEEDLDRIAKFVEALK